jgi:hypothetical protein
LATEIEKYYICFLLGLIYYIFLSIFLFEKQNDMLNRLTRGWRGNASNPQNYTQEDQDRINRGEYSAIEREVQDYSRSPVESEDSDFDTANLYGPLDNPEDRNRYSLTEHDLSPPGRDGLRRNSTRVEGEFNSSLNQFANNNPFGNGASVSAIDPFYQSPPAAVAISVLQPPANVSLLPPPPVVATAAAVQAPVGTDNRRRLHPDTVLLDDLSSINNATFSGVGTSTQPSLGRSQNPFLSTLNNNPFLGGNSVEQAVNDGFEYDYYQQPLHGNTWDIWRELGQDGVQNRTAPGNLGQGGMQNRTAPGSDQLSNGSMPSLEHSSQLGSIQNSNSFGSFHGNLDNHVYDVPIFNDGIYGNEEIIQAHLNLLGTDNDSPMATLHMPIFDPSNLGGPDAYTFLDHFARWCDCQTGNVWDTAKRLKVIGIFCRNAAVNYLNQYEKTNTNEAGQWDILITWDKFKEDFIKAFPSTVGKQHFEERLLSRVLLPNETVENYLYSVLDLIQKIEPNAGFERKYAHVKRGLPPMLRLQLSLQNPTTLQAMTSNLLSIGQAYQSAGSGMGMMLPQTPGASVVGYGNVPHGLTGIGTEAYLPSTAQTVLTPQQQHNLNSSISLQSVLDAIKTNQNSQTAQNAQKIVKEEQNTSILNQLREGLGKVNTAVNVLQSKVAGQNSNMNRDQNNSRFNRNRNDGKQWARINLIEASPSQDPVPTFFVPAGYSGNSNNNPGYSSNFSNSQGNNPGRNSNGNGYNNSYDNNRNRGSYNSNRNPNSNFTRDSGNRQGYNSNRGNNSNENYRGNRLRGSNLSGFPGQMRDSTGAPICFGCGQGGHMARDCPDRDNRRGNNSKN